MRLADFWQPALIGLISEFFLLLALRFRRRMSLTFFYIYTGGIMALLQLSIQRASPVLPGGLFFRYTPTYLFSLLLLTILIMYELFDLDTARNYSLSLIIGRIFIFILFFFVILFYFISQKMENPLKLTFGLIGEPLLITTSLLGFIVAIFVSVLLYALLRSKRIHFFISSILSIWVSGIVYLAIFLFPTYLKLPKIFLNNFYQMTASAIVLPLFTLIFWKWMKGK